ncbi:WxcM-like domain-containing protein, partial [Salmonella enterica]|nr:WxcM-like domain-containing protein [Salmonella enterica]
MDIKFIPLQTHGDDRGSLVALEEGHNIPFKIKRVYYIFDTKKGVHRGFH